MTGFARNTTALETDPAVRALLDAPEAQTLDVARDQRLGAPGQRMEHVYVVTRGLLKVSHLSGEDRAATSRLIGPGGLVGDVDVLVDEPHITETSAVVDSTVCAVPGGVFLEMLQENPFAFQHLHHVCARFCVVARQQRAILYDVKTRAASLLLAYAEAFPKPTTDGLRIAHPLTRADLAQDLGANLRSVSRVFTEWRHKGIVAAHKGWIVIRDAEALHRESGDLHRHLHYPAAFDESDREGTDFWSSLPAPVPPPPDALERLRHNPVFAHVSENELAKLLVDAHWLNPEAQENVIEAGQRATYVDVLLSGRMRVFHAAGEERNVTVKHLGAPCTLGEMQALTGVSFVQYAEALTPCELIRLRAETFDRFLQANGVAARGLLRDVAGRLYLAYRNEAAILANVPGRVASLLLSYAEAFGRETDQGTMIRYPLTQRTIALEIGATTKSINRTFAAWKEDGWVELHKGWCVLRDRAKLEECCGGLRFNLKYEADPSGGISPSLGS